MSMLTYFDTSIFVLQCYLQTILSPKKCHLLDYERQTKECSNDLLLYIVQKNLFHRQNMIFLTLLRLICHLTDKTKFIATIVMI